MVHEVGHFFGLAHSPGHPEATMWACADAGETMKRDLAEDDVEGICAIYGGERFDGQVCDDTPIGGLDGTCPDVLRGRVSCAVSPGRQRSCALVPWLVVLALIVRTRLTRR
jgi:hypothetical protein